MMMGGFGMGFGSWIWMAVFWIVLIGGGIWLLATLFPKGAKSFTKEENTTDALSILQQRYARGELSKEEYETIRHDLEKI